LEVSSADVADVQAPLAAEGAGAEVAEAESEAQSGDLERDASDEEGSDEVSASTSSTSSDSGTADDSFDASALYSRPGDEGMPRQDTVLFRIEQEELVRLVNICVPEGMMENRLVTFVYEGRRHDVAIPEGFEVGQQVPIRVPRRPPLERNQAQGACRGHQLWENRSFYWEPLRHSPRVEKNCMLTDEEFRRRYEYYTALRGRGMDLLLPNVPEEVPADDDVERPDGQDPL